MKKFFAVLFLAFGFFGLNAKDIEDTSKPVLRIGIEVGYPPMVFDGANGVEGLEIDFIKKFCKERGFTYTFIKMSFNELIPALLDKRIDIIMSGMSITETRAMRVSFTDSYATVGQMALVRRIDAPKYPDLASILNSIGNVGAITGNTSFRFVKENLYFSNLIEQATTKDAIESLTSRKIDMFIADAPLIMWLAQNFENQGIIPLRTLLTKEQLAWAVRKEDHWLRIHLNNFLKESRKNGFLDAILIKWMPFLFYKENLPNS